MITEIRFKKLINGKGFYAEIGIEIILTNESGIYLDFENDSPWYHSIKFGTDYFYDIYKRSKKGGGIVKVRYLKTQIIDTTHVVVLYVYLMALLEGFGIEQDELVINNAGCLVLPK